MTHTPGPWKLDEKYTIVEDISGIVCRFNRADFTTYANWYANAHLIAAAPDLLKALEGIVALSEGSDRLDWPEYVEAQRAIKKAKGV